MNHPPREIREPAADARHSRATAKRVLLLCQIDGYANGVKPVEVKRFLEQRGHSVHLVDTYHLSRAGDAHDRWRSKLPGHGIRRWALYGTEAASVILTRRAGFVRRRVTYPLFLAEHWLRRGILRSSLPLDSYDLVVCEEPFDSGVLSATSAPTLYDCPTPFADELYCEGRLTERQHRRFRVREAATFEGSDHLAFWWPSTARYASAYYGISGDNLTRLDYGCTPAPQRAEFADPPRIAYMGSLSSRFIDLPLLGRLTRLYPHIDVYGGPPPDARLGLNFCGYASPKVLRRYQLGLITCTKDPLRRYGFSAKHMQYLAYGLPALVPAWRRSEDLPAGSVQYDESTFASLVTALANRSRWEKLSDRAYAAASRFSWDKTLRPLEDLLN